MSNLIVEINENDVLSGRGGTINSHSGNVKFRKIVLQFKGAYKKARNRFDKTMISDAVVKNIRSMNPPGRFLAEVQGSWVDIGDEKARLKVSQALREKKIYKKIYKCGYQEQESKECMQPQATLAQNNSWDAPRVTKSTDESPPSNEEAEREPDQMSSFDSWDQGIEPVQEVLPHINTHLQQRLNSPKRILFHQLKEEATCLVPMLCPSPKSVNLLHDDNDELMRESFKSLGSVEISSLVEMSPRTKQTKRLTAVGVTTRKPTREMDMDFFTQHAFNNSNVRFAIADTKMDSTDKLIHDTFMSSISSFDVYDDRNRFVEK